MERFGDNIQQLVVVNFFSKNTQFQVPDGFLYANTMIDI